jgi:hypothetical protein
VAEGRVAGLLAAVLASLLLAGCTGVPEAGAVHRTQAAQDVKGVADYPQQQAQGPLPKATKANIIEGLLTAMSAGDNTRAQQFMTSAQAALWSPPAQALIFSFAPEPTAVARTDDKQWSLTLTQTAIIDSSSSYRRANGSVRVTFGFQQVAGEWRVSSISPVGSTFILAASLAQSLTPKTLYFPSRLAGLSGIPRLVPDTVFLPRGSTDLAGLLQQLLAAGPTHWLAPAVSATTPPSVQVLSALPDSNGGTTISLQHLGTLSAAAIRTLEAQIAYTLHAAQPQPDSSPITILSNGQLLAPPYTLSEVADAYNPDVLPPGSPFYFVRKDQLLEQTTTTQVAPNVAAGTTLPPEAPTPVIAQLGGVGQIAVSAVVATPAGSPSQAVAGVLTSNGTATLEVGAIPSTLAVPWTAVPLPVAKAFSTPSFDAVGRSVWTVATSTSGATQVYRIPYGVGTAVGTPEPVTVTNAVGKPVDGVTVVRLSRDGARAAVVANGHAYVGVVAVHGSASGDVWTVSETRPITDSTPPATTDVDVFWADQFRVGVVVQTVGAKGQVQPTKLETVPADGYDTGASTSTSDQALVAGAPSGAVQFSGGPGLLWLVSFNGRLARQSTPGSTDDDVSGLKWDDLGEGTWPSYAG